MPGDREAYLAAGMDGFVSKPIAIDALAQALMQAAAPAEALAKPAAAAPEVLDSQRLEHMRALQDEHQPTLVRELIDLFVADAPGHLEDLQQALRAADAQRLASVAHRFLSATDNIGARRLSALCVELEQLSRQGRLDGTPQLVVSLALEHQRARQALLAARLRF